MTAALRRVEALRGLRVLVVEDEPPSRARLVRALAQLADVAVVAEAEDAPAARAALAAATYDVVFLDIALPGSSGLELAADLPPEARPLVVFVTAHPEHALGAFDVEALDFLAKPWTRERLARVVARAAQWCRVRAARPLALRRGGRAALVAPEDVDYAVAARNYVRVHTARGELLSREPLEALLERLPAGRFARIHRSTLVRLDAVARLEAGPPGSARVVLRDGTLLPVGRSWLAALRRALGS